MRSGSVRFNRRLPAKERKDQTQHDANDDAGNDREVESAVSSFDSDVAGQTAQPTRPDASPKQHAESDDHEANNDEQFPELRHTLISHEICGRATEVCHPERSRDPAAKA